MRWLVCAITVVAMVVGCQGPHPQGPEVNNSAPATVKNVCDNREAAEESDDVELPEDVLGVYYMRAVRAERVSSSSKKSRAVHYLRWEIGHETDQDKKPYVRLQSWMANAPLASEEPKLPVTSAGIDGDPCYDTEAYSFKVDDVSRGNEEGDFMDAVFLSLSSPLGEAKLRLGEEDAGWLTRGIRNADLMKRAGGNEVFSLSKWVSAGRLTPENDADLALSAEIKAFLDGCAEKGTSASSQPGAG